MKKRLLTTACILWLLMAALAVGAQTPTVFRVKAGQYPEKVIPYGARYQFDQFRAGKAIFIGGKSADARFNYHYLGGSILFVDSRRDTLELTDKEVLQSVVIGEKTFRFSKQFGYCEIVKTFTRTALGKREVLTRIGMEKGGPYGISYTASSVTTYRSYSTDRSAANKLTTDASAVFAYRTAHFFVDNNNRFLVPTAGSVKKLYPSVRKQIAQYLKENPVNFAREDDLLRLLTFCEELIR